MSDAPERIDVLLSARGDMAINSRGEPLNGGKGDTHITYIRADLVRALPAVQPKVKPLVWASEGPWDKAHCSYGDYYIQYDDETQAWFASLELGEDESPIILSPSDVPNWGDAEAAAQADYEARILSAIVGQHAAKGGDA